MNIQDSSFSGKNNTASEGMCLLLSLVRNIRELLFSKKTRHQYFGALTPKSGPGPGCSKLGQFTNFLEWSIKNWPISRTGYQF